jgi:uncharacterized protein
MEISLEISEIILNFARDVVRFRVVGGELHPPDLAHYPQLLQPAGCFVSLHRCGSHALRGCIGMLQSDRPLIETLRGSAEAVLKDPRFTHDPVTAQELPNLEIEVTVIHPMQPAPSPLEFEPKTQGIFLTVAGHNGCFLPQVARDTGWSREQLLARLCTEKLGLHADAWRHPSAALQTFSVEVIGPGPLLI